MMKFTKFRSWRLERGYSLQHVADMTGYSTAMLSRLERGEREAAPAAKVAMARRLRTRISELFDLEN